MMRDIGNTGLPRDWVVLPAIDPELKRYILLAYLQRVGHRFAERKLYPYLEDLQDHVVELVRLRKSKDELARLVAGPLLGFDPRTGEAIHERPEEDELLAMIDEVIDFSIPGMRKALSEGKELRQEISERINFFPVGIQPLNATEGWLLLRTGSEVRVYGYAMPLLREANEELQYRSVNTRFATTYGLSMTCTYEHIRSQLRSMHKERPNPATFVFEAEVPLPHIETFMPLAKQLVYEHISKANA